MAHLRLVYLTRVYVTTDFNVKHCAQRLAEQLILKWWDGNAAYKS